MKRILKRTFVIIIAFVLVFAISIPCFADDSKPSPAGFNSWTTQEKVSYLGNTAAQIISSVTGLASGSGGNNFKQLCLDLYANQPEAGVYSYYEYLAKGLSFDDDTETWELSDDLVDFCNKLIVAYNDKVTMTYRYPIAINHVTLEDFPNKQIYVALYDLCNAYPDYLAYFYNSGTYTVDGRGKGYLDTDGNWQTIPYDSASDWYMVHLIKKPYGVITSNMTLEQSACAFYDDNFVSYRDVKTFFFKVDDNSYKLMYAHPDNPSSAHFMVEVEKGSFPSLDDVDCYQNSGWYPATLPLWLSQYQKTSLAMKVPYTASAGSINCYKSEADLKKDLGDQFIGSYTPDYTGTTAKTVSQDTVTNITNNYYNGGSSGSDNSGGGSSGGGFFDDIISGIASGVGSIIKGIFSIIKDLVDAIADAIVSITKSITDLMGLLKGDFTSFLSAVFPFMPEEFITIMVASLALCLLGVIIKIFRG